MRRRLIVVVALVALALPYRATAATDPYGNPKFSASLAAGLTAFYQRDFASALKKFQTALAVAPGEALALAFENATLAQQDPGALSDFAAREEEAVAKSPRSALLQTKLAYTYLFMAQNDPTRDSDAREALNAALAADPHLAAAHVGMGIYRFKHASQSRAKAEFLAALALEPRNVLAREYLSSIYQNTLGDPNRALSYLIDVTNTVPHYADAFFHLASIMDDLGQYEAAIRYLRTAIDLDAGHVGEAGQQGLPLLGDIYLKIHRIADAKLAFAEAVVFGEEPGYAQMQLDKIKRGEIK